jgi:Uma2 family endonuclease
MVAAGVFPPRERQRLEFIRGEVREMSPIGPLHEAVVDFLNEWSVERLPKRRFWVRVQNSIAIAAADSAPEPDLCWVARRRYSHGRPEAADVLLLIEVAESSLDHDCTEKAELYAAAGIPEYWIVNILDRAIEVCRAPRDGRYQDVRSCRGQEELRPLAAPEVALRPDDIWSGI